MTTAERRFLPAGQHLRIERRAEDDAEPSNTATLVGYAPEWNQLSSPLWHQRGADGKYKPVYEMFEPGSWDEFLASDLAEYLVCVRNHDRDRLLGRVGAGTLRVADDKVGNRYEVDLDLASPIGVETVRAVERRDLWGSSFYFYVLDDDDSQSWVEKEDHFLRTIKKVYRAEDVGPVTSPAYAQENLQIGSDGRNRAADLRSCGYCDGAVAAFERWRGAPAEAAQEREMMNRRARLHLSLARRGVSAKRTP